MTFPRMWTRREDEMIIANSNGWLSLNLLERRLGRSFQEINARASEIGVSLYLTPRVRTNRKRKELDPIPQDRDDFTCVTGEDDPLLARLRKYHGDKTHGEGS